MHEVGRPTVEDLIAFLDLSPEQLAHRAGPRVRKGSVFGGEILALGIRAAAADVADGLVPHSLHCYFLNGGQADGLMVASTVVRDGRNSAVRQISVTDGVVERGRMVVSFHRPQQSDHHMTQQPFAQDPEGPGPWRRDAFTEFDDSLPFEIRHDPVPRSAADPATARFWARARGSLPEDPVIHMCALAMASDMRTGVAASAPLKASGAALSIDHAMWFHRPMRADQWFLVNIEPISVVAGRGLVTGTVHAADSMHGASFAQEALVRKD